MESVNDNINNILALHFTGEKLTDDQEKMLIDWVCRNREEYGRLSELFQSAKDSNRMNFDVKQAWNKIDRKLDTPKTSLLYHVRHYFAYAACIAVMVGMALFFTNKHKDGQQLFSNTTAMLQTVMLPDSSTVTLYPQSRISYLANAKSHERETELEGRAFFKVKPNPDQPFIVRSNRTTIKVLGTSFLVNGTDSSETGIFVREGVVQVSTEKDKVVLKADEQALSDGEDIVKSRIEDSESVFEKHIKEKTYKEAPLSEVIKDIKEEFNVQIVMDDSMLNNRISTSIKFVNLEDILSEISYICGLKYKKLTEKKYEFYKP